MNNNWHSLSLGDGITAVEPSEEIREVFLEIFTSMEHSMETAVFTRLESEGRLHCEVIAYFSPAAQKLADLFDAEPCEKPARSGLGLLAGDVRCWPALFPEENFSR